MKKFILIFAICCFPLISSSILGLERYNCGKAWKSWFEYERDIYIRGFKDGLLKGFSFFLEELKTDQLKQSFITDSEFKFQIPDYFKPVIDRINIDIKSDIVEDVVTDLYNDPANTFIGFGDMIYLAIDKLKGERIDEKLIEARRSVERSYQILQDIENKQDRTK